MARSFPFGLVSLATCGLLLAGCVERRYLVVTDPPGAIVYNENNFPIGASPVDHPFTYYGKYRFTLVRDGCQTQVMEENIAAPWYELPVLDFVSENLIPFTIRDTRVFQYQLQPTQIVPPDAVLQQAEALRRQGQALPSPIEP